MYVHVCVLMYVCKCYIWTYVLSYYGDKSQIGQVDGANAEEDGGAAETVWDAVLLTGTMARTREYSPSNVSLE